MNALLEASVDLGTYQVDYTDFVPDPLNPGQFTRRLRHGFFPQIRF